MDIYEFLKKSYAYKAFLRENTCGRTFHSYIVSGEDKSVTENLIKLFAAVILCKSADRPCLKCHDCRRILNDTHPDCRNIKPEKIVVEDIDNLINEALYRPCEGNIKVFLLCGGDTMNAASQNKLLKTLEEPTGSVYIIISAQNTENLLPTIKSRCRMLETGQFGEEDIYNYLICAGTDNKKAMTVSKICGGSLGKALDIISNENYINMYNFISGLFDKLQSYEDVLRCMEIFNAVEDKNAALDIMQMIFHDKMLRAAENDRKGKNNGYSVKSLICFIEKTSEAKRKLSLNCNPAAVIETLLIDIVEKGKEEQI